MYATSNTSPVLQNKCSEQEATACTSKGELAQNRKLSGKPQNTTTVWHYTIGLRAEKILQCGIMRGATKHVPLNERPVVWFSMSQTFEPTAAKLKIQNGVTSSMSIAEMIELGRGVVRFGLPPSTLLTGDTLKKRARITSKEWSMLKASGLKMGADARNWYGSIEPVDASLCTFEVMSSTGKWERVVPSEWLLQTATPA